MPDFLVSKNFVQNFNVEVRILKQNGISVIIHIFRSILVLCYHFNILILFFSKNS